jgi:glycolate oxidase
MSLSKETYREFEDVVGEENICSDSAIMPAYFNTEFAAVVLPKDAAEVQAIVKLCNKHKLRFRPICTGWSWTGKFPEDIILLDLRRMNQIIEINEKNMYAVVEPYVISGQLQAELFKRGLNMNVKGAGSNCTALLRGHGHMDEYTSGEDRNHLAIEWVTPEGDLVRLGALGSTGDWFTGDGPGPSLRSLINSVVPPGVSPGVFTKAAIKLYHWPGPASYPVVGKSPKYTLSEIPPYMMARYYSFSSVEKLWQAELKIGESEIALVLMGFNAAMVACNITTCGEEEIEVFERIRKEVQGPGFLVIIAGNSATDFVYKKKVLEKIIKDANGKSLKMVEDPEVEGILLCQCTRISASIRETFRAAGALTGIPFMGQRDLIIKWAIGASKAKKELVKKGQIVDDAGAFFGWGVENGHLGKTEIFCRYDTTDPDAGNAVQEWFNEQIARAYNEHYFLLYQERQLDKVGPRMSNFHLWWRKFKAVIDPNGLTNF